MRCLERNKQELHYALYLSETETQDAFGNYTGERHIEYSDPVAFRAYCTPASGHAKLKAFGITEDYDYSIVTADKDIPIKEDSIVWYGISPTAPHNCRVAWISKTLNGVNIGLKRVDVS